MPPSRVFRPALSPFRPTHRKRMERLHGIRLLLSWLRSTPAAKQGSGTATRTLPLPSIVNGVLAEAVVDLDAFQIPLAHEIMLRRIRNIGRRGACRDRNRSRGFGAVGSQRQVAGFAGRISSRRGARRRSDLRQRRLHHLLHRPSEGTAWRLGQPRHALGEDESGH